MVIFDSYVPFINFWKKIIQVFLYVTDVYYAERLIEKKKREAYSTDRFRRDAFLDTRS